MSDPLPMFREEMFLLPKKVAPLPSAPELLVRAGSGDACVIVGSNPYPCVTARRLAHTIAPIFRADVYYGVCGEAGLYALTSALIEEQKVKWVVASTSGAERAIFGISGSEAQNSGAWQLGRTRCGHVFGVAHIPPFSSIGVNPYIARRVEDDLSILARIPLEARMKEAMSATYHLIRAGQAPLLRELFKENPAWIAFDTETTGVTFDNIKPFCVSMSTGEVTAVVTEAGLLDPEVVEEIRRLLTTRRVVGHNVKFDYHVAKQGLGITLTDYDCTRLLLKLLHTDAVASLDAASLLVGIGGHKADMEEQVKKVVAAAKRLDKKNGPSKPSIENPTTKAYAYYHVDRDLTHRYAAGDAWTCAKLYLHLRRIYEREAQNGRACFKQTWIRLTKPFLKASIAMEEEGIHIDLKELDRVRVQMAEQMLNEACEVSKASDGRIQPSSYDDLRRWMEDNHIDTGLRTPTDRMALPMSGLKPLAPKHDVIAHVIAYRGAAKLLDGYLKTLPDFIRPDGKVHPNILIDGTRTGGRISVREPALQTIPPTIRPVFIGGPSEEWLLITSDYKTLEIYVAAAWSQDPVLKEAISGAIDFHTSTAMRLGPSVWKMTPEEVLREIEADLKGPEKHSTKRAMAKKTAFAVLYGMGPLSLSDALGCTEQQAAAMINGFFGAYNILQRKLKAHIRSVMDTGYSVSEFDGTPARVRWIPEIGWPGKRGHGINAACNMPIQAQAADICTSACIELVRGVKERWGDLAAVALTVHDSIVVRAHASISEECAQYVRSVMESQPCGGLQLKVDQKIGHKWS